MIKRTDPGNRPQRRTWTGEKVYWVLIGAAIGWGIVILFLAVTYPAESVDTGRAGVQPMHSLVAADGYGVLWAAAIPLLIAVIVGCLHRARPDARLALTTEWILSGALLLASLVGFVTIIVGIYVLPAAALLVIATGQATSRRPGASRLHGKHPLDDANSHHPPTKRAKLMSTVFAEDRGAVRLLELDAALHDAPPTARCPSLSHSAGLRGHDRDIWGPGRQR